MVYLQGYDQRYSINKKGEVFCLYRVLKNSNILKQKIKLAKNIKNRKSCIVSLMRPDGKVRAITVNTLMCLVYGLNPPDKNHQYKLLYKDGNHFNNSIDNLIWVIHTRVDYNFTPQCTHKNGAIISKRCGNCGDYKSISNYTYSCNPNHKNANSLKFCYRNQCEQCRSKYQWGKLNSDPALMKRFRDRVKEWESKPSSKKWIKEYLRNHGLKERAELTNSYVDTLIRRRGLNPESFTEEMKDILREQVKIKRYIKEIK